MHNSSSKNSSAVPIEDNKPCKWNFSILYQAEKLLKVSLYINSPQRANYNPQHINGISISPVAKLLRSVWKIFKSQINYKPFSNDNVPTWAYSVTSSMLSHEVTLAAKSVDFWFFLIHGCERPIFTLTLTLSLHN